MPAQRLDSGAIGEGEDELFYNEQIGSLSHEEWPLQVRQFLIFRSKCARNIFRSVRERLYFDGCSNLAYQEIESIETVSLQRTNFNLSIPERNDKSEYTGNGLPHARNCTWISKGHTQPT